MKNSLVKIQSGFSFQGKEYIPDYIYFLKDSLVSINDVGNSEFYTLNMFGGGKHHVIKSKEAKEILNSLGYNLS